MKSNGILEDLGAIMGTEAALRLVAIFGGGQLYVPATADAGHPIGSVVGMGPFRRLVAELGGETFSVPAGGEFVRLRRVRRVVRLLSDGVTEEDLARLFECTPRTIRNIRREGVQMRLVGRCLPRD